jgi:hypothetical protein
MFDKKPSGNIAGRLFACKINMFFVPLRGRTFNRIDFTAEKAAVCVQFIKRGVL